MKILSIDLASSKKIAWAFIEHGRVTQFGSTHKKGTAGLRELLDKIGNAEAFFPHMIVTEKPYMKMNPRVFGKFSEMVGHIREFCYLNNINFFEVMPAHWKKAYLKGTGFKASSKEANNFLNHIAFNYVKRNNFTPDERDAILFGLFVSRRQ